jgi:hypothetical protein
MKVDKYLVVRRDGSIPKWPAFVLGGRDPAAPAALLAYAKEAEKLGMDAEYVEMVRQMANQFDRYRADEGPGDPDAPPLERPDNYAVLEALAGNPSGISVHTDSFNSVKGFDADVRRRL